MRSPDCGYSTHRDYAAAQMVLIRGLDNVVPQELGERKLPGHAVLLGDFCLDKWLSGNARLEIVRMTFEKLKIWLNLLLHPGFFLLV